MGDERAALRERPRLRVPVLCLISAVQVDVITLFPEVVTVPLGASIAGRAQERGLLTLRVHDLRPHGIGKYRQVDDEPYGGGPGMVLRPEPIAAALEPLRTP